MKIPLKIALIGEYSGVHWNLAQGLRVHGHKVVVVSNGDFWKNYPRDISLLRGEEPFSGLRYYINLIKILPKLRDFDIVQIINPMFLELKAERLFTIYNFLRKKNKKIFLSALGMDAYWIEGCRNYKLFRYSDFNIGQKPIINEETTALISDWKEGSPKNKLNRYIANNCDGIIAGMYEYHSCYKQLFEKKLCYIPLPINLSEIETNINKEKEKINFFIGIQKNRSIYKGTDIMLKALQRIEAEYPDRCTINRAENIPFAQYTKLINESDVLLDQLYGFSPGMNALLAMAKGMVVVGGAEEECYKILGEKQLRPMTNVIPSENDVYEKLRSIVLSPEKLPNLKQESIEFVEKHHSHIKIATQYLDFWDSCTCNPKNQQ